ncbi:uncharacterized protein V6R79_022640 [Siganus canaliculatus]
MKTLLLSLLLLAVSYTEAQRRSGPVKEYYIAAVEIGWDYIHLDDTDQASDQSWRSKDIPQKYIKAVYREYTDATYTVPKTRPAWAGIQGPVIIAQASDKVVIHFKNLASQPYSISPVGITYWKQSEGASYDDSTTGHEKEDDAVFPGGYYEYVWDISPKDGPTANDPECLTYSYSSQVDIVRDLNSGLIGALLICKSSARAAEGQEKNTALVLLFAVFDETKSWYGEVGERRSREKKKSSNRKEYHTINGYVNSTLPGLNLCQSHVHVFWHMIGVGTAPEIHSIQFQDHSLMVLKHRKVTVDVTPMTYITAQMRPATAGRFGISCQIHAHRHYGMNALFTVEKCLDPVNQLGPEVRKVKDEDYIYDEDEDIEGEDEDNLFKTITFPLRGPHVRSSRGQQQNVWHHFIAIEEITWDYAPHLDPTDRKFQSGYLPPAPHHLDYRYKKAVYVEYTDGSFTKRMHKETALMGPLLKGRVSDEIHITLKNQASRPFNIYPNSLTKIYPLPKSANVKDLRSLGIPPNKTFRYVWKLTADDGPLTDDPQCLTQLYQSTVSPEEDLASGLVGTLLICKYEAIDLRGDLFKVDKTWSVIFAVFDENKSWYINENMQKSSSNTTDPELYNSNVIYSVNGIMFGGRQFVLCQTHVANWHVASVGTQSDFLSVYFTGNLFEYEGLYQTVLTLFPMTAVTVPMEPELMGEWEISAFDGTLKSRGMSIQYTVRLCNNADFPLADTDGLEDNIFDYMDEIDQMPRGTRPRTGTTLVRVCKPPVTSNSTMSMNTSGQNVTNNKTDCRMQRVIVPTREEDTMDAIPQDVLDELEIGDKELKPSQNETEHGGEAGVRHRRQAENNGTDVEISSGDPEDTEVKIQEQALDNRTSTNDQVSAEKGGEASGAFNETKGELEENNEILPHSSPPLREKAFDLEPTGSEEMDQNFIQSEPERLRVEYLLDLDYNNTDDNNTADIDLSLEYDDYSEEVNGTTDTFATDYVNPRSGGVGYRHYYIAAEEINWDYGIRKPHQFIKPGEIRRGMRKFLPAYKKVVFRAYKDEAFKDPLNRGERDEHLGILGPIIRTEINDVLTVIFKNKASRPYSFHLHGVYDRSQAAGMARTHASSAPPGIPGDPVAPGEARTYNWRITKKQGPTKTEFDCKTQAYYSTVDKEKDLHSGLIGPLVICKSGTLPIHRHVKPEKFSQPDEFSLLFHAFDETKSWYLSENLKKYCTPPCQANTEDPWFHVSNKFAAINGYVAETLPGLLVAQHQPVRWHLLNVGSDGEYHAVHFHGLPFTLQAKEEHRMGVYNLFPGVFGTVEMRPPIVGTWLVECRIGDYQLAGMRAKLLVYNPRCVSPLGMKSGNIQDSQVTASDHLGNWKPQLARLHQSGYINAWMGRNRKSWLQVDLQRPTLLHSVQTQGVRSRLRDHYITFFNVSYSLDLDTWTSYRGNTSEVKTFWGNMDSSTVKDNHFIPPFVARYIRIHPLDFRQKPALRLELLGCDLNSCSLPLGLEKRLINDSSIDASSHYSSLLRTWLPHLARLNQEGSANAWRPKSNNPYEWLQVDLGSVKRITGVVTQGARSILTEMMVTEFSVTVSYDERVWSSVLDKDTQTEKIFAGNSYSDEEALVVFDPPLFGRFIRIHPKGWINDIALRLEVLGCDTQPGL